MESDNDVSPIFVHPVIYIPELDGKTFVDRNKAFVSDCSPNTCKELRGQMITDPKILYEGVEVSVLTKGAEDMLAGYLDGAFLGTKEMDAQEIIREFDRIVRTEDHKLL